MTGQRFDRRLILAHLFIVTVGAVLVSTSWAQGPQQAQQDDRLCGNDCGGVQSTAQQKEKPSDQQVTGEVVDKDGKPVKRAEVRFDGPKKDKVWTDDLGKFSFTGPPGKYVVTVKGNGLENEFKVTIEDNQLTPAQLITKPDSRE